MLLAQDETQVIITNLQTCIYTSDDHTIAHLLVCISYELAVTHGYDLGGAYRWPRPR